MQVYLKPTNRHNPCVDYAYPDKLGKYETLSSVYWFEQFKGNAHPVACGKLGSYRYARGCVANRRRYGHRGMYIMFAGPKGLLP